MVKTEHIKVLSHTTNPKNPHFATTTLKFMLAKCSVTISYVCSHPRGSRYLAPAQQKRATESGNQQLRQVTHIRDQSLRTHSISYRDEATVRSLRFPASLAHYYRVCCKQQDQDPGARINLHIQKRKPQASIENKIEKFDKLFDVYNTIHKR